MPFVTFSLDALTGEGQYLCGEEVYFMTPALDGYPLHLDKTLTPGQWHHSVYVHVSLWSMAHLLPSNYFHLSRPFHIFGSFATRPTITNAYHGLRPALQFLSLLRQGIECGGKWDNKDSQWRQGATWRQYKCNSQDNCRHNSVLWNVSSFLDLYAHI